MNFDPKIYKLLISIDYNLFDSRFNESGVYAAYGRVQSSFKTPLYIGSAENLFNRIINDHICVLKREKYSKETNRLLFNYCKKYGIENIEWYLLETCPPDKTLIIEQKYLDLYRPFADEFNGFNIAHDASAPMKGRGHTEEVRKRLSDFRKTCVGWKHKQETKDKIAENNRIRGCSQKTKDKISQSNKGRKWPEEEKENRLKNRGKVFLIQSPNGEIVEIKNLKKFSLENGLNHSCMQKVATRKRPQHKGWTVPN